jgi:hypothetical protein
VFEDKEHNTRTLQSLNMMRKNRHFCDVVLHVSTRRTSEMKIYRTIILSFVLYECKTWSPTLKEELSLRMEKNT